MRRPLVLLAIIMALAVGATAQPATAQEENDDIAGYWLVWIFNSQSPCLLFLERDGTDLTGGWACGDTGNGPLDGTTDGSEFSFSVATQLTGNFRLAGDGVLSENGRHLEGSWMFDTDLDKYPPLTGEFGETIRSGPRWADMNCDRAVNSLDAYYLLTSESEQCLHQISEVLTVRIDNWWTQGADVNLDGHRDSRDALLILQLEAGLIERLPVL